MVVAVLYSGLFDLRQYGTHMFDSAQSEECAESRLQGSPANVNGVQSVKNEIEVMKEEVVMEGSFVGCSTRRRTANLSSWRSSPRKRSGPKSTSLQFFRVEEGTVSGVPLSVPIRHGPTVWPTVSIRTSVRDSQ